VTRQQGQRQSGQDRQDRKIKTSTCQIFDKMKEIDPQLQVSIENPFLMQFFLSTVQRQNNFLGARWILKALHKRFILVRITVLIVLFFAPLISHGAVPFTYYK
jgi:hypothetical protein